MSENHTGSEDAILTQQVVYDGDPTVCGDLAAYSFYIWCRLQWLCDDCGAFEIAANDMPDEEQYAPEGDWAIRKATEAMNQGWFVLPLDADGSLLHSPCYCPDCARRRELFVLPQKE